MKVVLDEGAKAPTRAHDTDAGIDLYSMEDVILFGCKNGMLLDSLDGSGFPESFCEVGSTIVDTGVHVELPPNTCGLLVSKSGLNINHGITSTGLIDEGYTGSIKVKLYNNNRFDYEIHKGDKITQLLILPVVKETIEVVDNLEETDRGDKGFGSSGR